MTDAQYSLDLHTECNHAKHANQNRKKDVIYTFYDDNMVKMPKEQDDLNGRFEEALANEEFELFLQLKWDLKKNHWAGAEALCRWRDPIKGLISPGKFIPLFEQNGRIVKLDEYMFEQTCKIISKMMANGERCVPVSFNLSKRNFQDLSFIDRYQEIIEKYNIPHELIEIEITEGLLVDNVEAFTSFIKIFHENDFHISMDDFGTEKRF
jgi:EAL domain-containing protein (putative c-di-GMP-specific phosphodiesterase class I)